MLYKKTGEFQHNSFHQETASHSTIRLSVCDVCTGVFSVIFFLFLSPPIFFQYFRPWFWFAIICDVMTGREHLDVIGVGACIYKLHLCAHLEEMKITIPWGVPERSTIGVALSTHCCTYIFYFTTFFSNISNCYATQSMVDVGNMIHLLLCHVSPL